MIGHQPGIPARLLDLPDQSRRWRGAEASTSDGQSTPLTAATATCTAHRTRARFGSAPPRRRTCTRTLHARAGRHLRGYRGGRPRRRVAEFRHERNLGIVSQVIVGLTAGAHPRGGRRDLVLRFPRLVGCSALLGNPPVCRTARAVLRTPLSASLTARSVGKASATSRSIKTMFVPSCARRAGLATDAALHRGELLLGRMSVNEELDLLLHKTVAHGAWQILALMIRNSIAGLGVGHHHDSAERRQPDDQKLSLAVGMINVRKRRRQQVVENGRGLSKVDTMRLETLFALSHSRSNSPYLRCSTVTIRLPNDSAQRRAPTAMFTRHAPVGCSAC